MGIPEATIKWTISHASTEFGLSPTTVAKRLKSNAIDPGEDGKFTTKQIVIALFGDKDGARLRLTNEQADKIALENAVARGQLISVEDAAVLNRRVAYAVRQKILALPLSEEIKNGVLHEIQRLGEVDFTKVTEGDDERDQSP